METRIENKKKSAASTKTPEQATHSNAFSPNLSGIFSELSPDSLSFNSHSNSSQLPLNSPPINNPEDSDSDEESNLANQFYMAVYFSFGIYYFLFCICYIIFFYHYFMV